MADPSKPLLDDGLHRNGPAWGSQELNALLDALPNAQSLPRMDSGGFLNSPKWRALLGMDDDSPMHLDSSTSTTLPLQSRPKRAWDAMEGDAVALSGSECPSPAKQPRREAVAALESAQPGAQGLLPRADSLLPIPDEFLMDALGGGDGLVDLGMGPSRAGTPTPPPTLPSHGSLSLPAAMAALAFSTPLAQGFTPSATELAPPSDAVARVQLVPSCAGGQAGAGSTVHTDCSAASRAAPRLHPLQAFMGGGKIKPLARGLTTGTAAATPIKSEGGMVAAAAGPGPMAAASPRGACTAAGLRQEAAGSTCHMDSSPAETAGAVVQPSVSSLGGGRRKYPHLVTKSSKAVPTSGDGVFTSLFRGVTKHKLTGRFEAHFWDSSFKRENTGRGGRTKGRQVYLGGYETEEEAARAYDKAALTHMGMQAPLNFPLEQYSDFLASIAGKAPEEVVGELRRRSVGFARGQSQFRGVTKHHHQGKWEARIGRVDGNKYLYLGTFDSPEEAAKAYDRAAVKFRGRKAITNYDLSNYAAILADPDGYSIVTTPPCSSWSQGAQPSHPSNRAQQQQQHGRKASQQSAHSVVPAPAPFMMIPPVMFAPHMIGALPALPAPWALQAMQHMLAMPVPGGLAAAPAAGQLGAGGGMGMVGMPPGMSAQLHEDALLGMAVPVGYADDWQQQQQPEEVDVETPTAASNPTSPPAVPAVPLLGPSAAGPPTGGAVDAMLHPIPRLPAIRVRQPAATTSAGQLEGSLSGQLSLSGLTPLAASLLSPLGLSGDPAFWRDSPLGKELSKELSKLSQEDINRLLAGDASVFNSPTKAPGSAGGSDQGADFWAAVQWLEGLDPSTINPAPTPTSAAERPPGTKK